MATLKSHFAPAKLVFYFLFWGMQWGVFAYGW
jgi:NADPH oxidase